jgi:small subunit ribosomal protein S21
LRGPVPSAIVRAPRRPPQACESATAGRRREDDREKKRRGRFEMPTDAIQCKPLEVAVGDKGIERAIKHLKRKMAAEGILRELKRRRHYMKPSVKRRKKASEAARRRRKRSKMDLIA